MPVQLQGSRKVRPALTCAVGRRRCHCLQKIAQHCASIQRCCQPGALGARHLLHAPHDQSRLPCMHIRALHKVMNLLLGTPTHD